MLNTHPELYWASLELEACPPFLTAPASLPAFHSHSLHLYCSASSLTWDNKKIRNVITLT